MTEAEELNEVWTDCLCPVERCLVLHPLYSLPYYSDTSRVQGCVDCFCCVWKGLRPRPFPGLLLLLLIKFKDERSNLMEEAHFS